jgi:hypothetical protein
MRKRFPLLAVLALAVLSLGVAACGDDEEDTTATTETEAETAMAEPMQLALTGEETVLVLDSGTADVLAENKVKVEPVDPAGTSGDGIGFPITGGEVESESLAGTIEHSGGLVFSAGGTEVEVTDFVVDTAAGTLTATTADGAELALLDLDLSALERTDDGGVIVADGITAALTADAATALNDAFGVELFEEGLAIGDVTVRATA